MGTPPRAAPGGTIFANIASYPAGHSFDAGDASASGPNSLNQGFLTD